MCCDQFLCFKRSPNSVFVIYGLLFFACKFHETLVMFCVCKVCVWLFHEPRVHKHSVSEVFCVTEWSILFLWVKYSVFVTKVFCVSEWSFLFLWVKYSVFVSEVCAVYRVSDRGPTSVTDMPSKLHKLTNKCKYKYNNIYKYKYRLDWYAFSEKC